MEENRVILVDLEDRETGSMEKMEAHRQAKLHRAFSVFLYDGERMLLQKRASGKYHCGGLWTNACCSHPRPGEQLAEAAVRRLQEELGVRLEAVREEFSFTYYYHFENGLTEYEFDHVCSARYPEDGEIHAEPEEVEEIRWVSFEDLLREMEDTPGKFTPWFMICAPRLIRILRTGKDEVRLCG